MYSIGIIGDLGSFKTCLLTASAITSGRKIGANYQLIDVAYEHVPFSELVKIVDKKPEVRDAIADRLRGSFYACDELGKGADSYEWMSKQSQDLYKLSTDLRKLHMLFAYTVPNRDFITVRLRKM